MTVSDAISQGRDAFEQHAWSSAYALLRAADLEARLDADDLERLGIAAYLIGEEAQAASLAARTYSAWVDAGEVGRAARVAFHLVTMLAEQGEMAQAGGWLARAQGLLDDHGADCVERGYLMLPVALRHVDEGDVEAARQTFSDAFEIGVRFGDPDLMTLARMGRGRCLLALGRRAEGMALLDEVMVAVTSAEVSPLVAGVVYCAVIEACHDVFDMRRAQEWTGALTRWCLSQPDLVAYQGECLVRRAEIMQLHGAWRDAIGEAQRAREQLSRSATHSAIGAALYQEGESYRLRGEFTKAEEAYREASRLGRAPQPGLALLRLRQGQIEAARAAIERAMDEAEDPRMRSRLLAAYVEIMLATGDIAASRGAADELAMLAADLDAVFLNATSEGASGTVLLAEGDPRGALSHLRRSWMHWRELDAPYEAARVRVLIGRCCRALGDEDTAEMELDAARWVFEQLGAATDLETLRALSRPVARDAAGGLTTRELEVLRLVAAGRTNRAIAGELFISEKTVARHVSNIFMKLDVSSRSAATAYSYEHGLVR